MSLIFLIFNYKSNLYIYINFYFILIFDKKLILIYYNFFDKLYLFIFLNNKIIIINF